MDPSNRMSPQKQRVVVVLGMHRGGTSAVTRALKLLHVGLGDDLLPPSDDNPTGFWEDQRCLAINEELLRHCHSAYDRLGLAWRLSEADPTISDLKIRAAELVKQRLSEHGGLWGFKDPRTSRLSLFWRQAIEACGAFASYVIVVRNPMSVALSLKKRNNIPEEKSYLLWLQHMIPAVLDTAGSPRLVVDYDLMIDSPTEQIQRIGSVLGLELGDDRSPAEEYASGFLKKELRHTEFSVSHLALDSRMPGDVADAYKLLARAARDEISLDAGDVLASFKELNSRLIAFSAAFAYANRLEEDKIDLYGIIGTRDKQIASLGQVVAERDGETNSLKQALRQRGEELAAQKEAVARLESDISALKQFLDEREKQVASSKQALDDRNAQISAFNRVLGAEIESLNQTLMEREGELASFQEVLKELEGRKHQIASLSQALGERDHALVEREQALVEREQALVEQDQVLREREREVASLNESLGGSEKQVTALTQGVAQRDAAIANLLGAISSLKASLSWRITGPLRSVYGSWLKTVKSIESSRMRSVDRVAEQGPAATTAKSIANDPDPPPERDTPSAGTTVAAPRVSAADWTDDYVEDTPPPAHFAPDVKLVAFYLPQFHPIPENDEWWSKGFTEWTNVSRAVPQFEGHYQPHLPEALGFYDLRVPDVQRRQVELAKRYGIGAFCFYFYWFAGRRLLELPILQYLENSGLDLPFCLCWANENWTRRWDGLDAEVLIAQDHSPTDDIRFIEHVSRYMRDPRYLRVNGAPVLLVYRPSLLPNMRATTERWREWARLHGLGELYLVYPQSFETCDPAEYGFDAATEFPPNLSGPPIVTDQVQLYNPNFSGIVYDWRVLVERSRQYSRPAYKLFRGVCPSWDSEPRLSGRGVIFINSSPDGYGEWLQNAVADTRQRLRGDERMVFVNAWNEWAEGTHLEPDRRYGYAWLQASRTALLAAGANQDDTPPRRVVVVTHDAYPHGAQYIALYMAKGLAESLDCEVEIVCLGDGPLKADFAKYGRVHDLTGVDPMGAEAQRLAANLFQRGFQQAIINTTVGGLFLATLKQAGLRCVSLIHELREIMLSYGLQAHALKIAEHADYVVFPAPEVERSFSEFATIGEERVVIRPQGLLKRTGLAAGDRWFAREALRQEFGLAADAKIILAVGYADLRKGADYFLEIAAGVVTKDRLAHFVWLGHSDAEIDLKVSALAQAKPALSGHIHFIGRRDDTSVYYAGADVFALTSREDPFPCVVLEAMDAGLPVVAFSGSGGANALIAEGVGENVPKDDLGAFAASILRFLGDDEACSAIAQRGPAIIAERFSFRQYLFELLTLLGMPLRKVSVLIPNYNYEGYLADRIGTILKQTYPIYEVIFLDDASTDDSLALARRLLADAGVDYRIFPNPVNSTSVSLQWKRGVELARGDFVWIAEADDLSDPAFLATVLKGFDDSGVVLSYCESKQIDEFGGLLANNYHDYVSDLGRERWSRQYVNSGEDEIGCYMAVKNTIPNVSAVVMRRRELARVLTENIEDIRSHRVAGDWKTYLHLLPNARLAYFPQALNLHRRHQKGVTISAFNESQFREIRDIQEWVATRYALSPHVEAMAQHYLTVLREQFGLGRAP